VIAQNIDIHDHSRRALQFDCVQVMDGRNEDHSINLQKEFFTAENIVQLFQKYRVPLRFDHLTVDIDLVRRSECVVVWSMLWRLQWNNAVLRVLSCSLH
jgi:hypothetical protein